MILLLILCRIKKYMAQKRKLNAKKRSEQERIISNIRYTKSDGSSSSSFEPYYMYNVQGKWLQWDSPQLTKFVCPDCMYIVSTIINIYIYIYLYFSL